MRENAKNNREQNEIDLLELLMVYIKKWWIILICGVVGGIIALLYTLLAVTPLYQASVSMYVNNFRGDQYIESVSSANLSTSQMLVNTYVNIISSDTVLNKVIEETRINYTAGQLRNMLSSSQVNETEIFRIYITHENAEEAANIANSIALVAPDEIETFVEGSSCKILDSATVPTSPISPSVPKNTMMGVIMGLFIVVAIITVQHLLDTRIKTEEELENLFDIPVLVQVPSFSQNSSLYDDNEVLNGKGNEELVSKESV